MKLDLQKILYKCRKFKNFIMKTKKIIFLFSIFCAIMLLNISITNSGIHKLNVKVGSLKEAQADFPKDNNSFTTWYSPGPGDGSTQWFGQLGCNPRFGWFADPCYCSQAPH